MGHSTVGKPPHFIEQSTTLAVSASAASWSTWCMCPTSMMRAQRRSPQRRQRCRGGLVLVMADGAVATVDDAASLRALLDADRPRP